MDNLRRMDELAAMQTKLEEQPWGACPYRKTNGDEANHRTDMVQRDVLQTLSTPARFEELCDRVAHSRRVVLEALWSLFFFKNASFNSRSRPWRLHPWA